MNRRKIMAVEDKERLIVISRDLDRLQAHKFAEHFKDLFTPILIESNQGKMRNERNIYTTYKVCRRAMVGEFIKGHEPE